jgi:hypothetical protein
VEPQEEEEKEEKQEEEEEENDDEEKKTEKEEEARFGLIRRWEYMYKQETLTGVKEMVLRCLRVLRNMLRFKRKEYDTK